MLKYLWMVVMVCLLIPAAGLAEPYAEVSSSEVQIYQPVTAGETVTGTFSICNQGDTTLNIYDVAPSCRCTTPSFDRSIQPGDCGQIVLHVDTSGYHGHLRKSAVVQTDDPNHQVFQITVDCTVY